MRMDISSERPQARRVFAFQIKQPGRMSDESSRKSARRGPF